MLSVVACRLFSDMVCVCVHARACTCIYPYFHVCTCTFTYRCMSVESREQPQIPSILAFLSQGFYQPRCTFSPSLYGEPAPAILPSTGILKCVSPLFLFLFFKHWFVLAPSLVLACTASFLPTEPCLLFFWWFLYWKEHWSGKYMQTTICLVLSLKTENKDPSYIIQEEELRNVSLGKSALLYPHPSETSLKKSKRKHYKKEEGKKGKRKGKKKINKSFFSPQSKCFRLVAYFSLQDLLPSLSVLVYSQPQGKNTQQSVCL